MVRCGIFPHPRPRGYGVEVKIFRFGNAVSPCVVSSKAEGLDSNSP